MIDIHNTRMMQMWFDVVTFPAATVSAAVLHDAVAGLKADERRPQKVTYDLMLREQYGLLASVEKVVQWSSRYWPRTSI